MNVRPPTTVPGRLGSVLRQLVRAKFSTGVDSLSTDVVPGTKVPFLFLVQLVLRSTSVRIRIRTAVMCVTQDPACDTR